MTRFVALLLVLAACPKGGDKSKPADPGSGSGSAVQVVAIDATATGSDGLPAAPPLPPVPQSLPPLPPNARVTADAVAFGELLFFDPMLSPDGSRSCATCHDPARGFAGGIEVAADGKPNARRTPSLYNLAWVEELGWDGRAPSLTVLLPTHMKGQLDSVDRLLARMVAVENYGKYAARVGGTPGDAVIQALEAYVLTRYEGDTPWDSLERTERSTPAVPNNPITAGYRLFMGKAQCAQCHPPPLYTDNAYHRVIKDAHGDKGRGLVEPAKAGAFRTPTLRGAITRGAYFHDGSKSRIEDVIAYYQSAEAAAIDPTFAKIKLTSDEARSLGMFLTMLSNNRPPYQKPAPR